jgi:hypothetical protein
MACVLVLQVIGDTEDFFVYKISRALQPPTPDRLGSEATVSVGRHTLTKVGGWCVC